MGKITYHGGDWPKTAKISFVMTQPAAGSPMQSGSADLKPDGTFKASTFDVGDGLVPGDLSNFVRSVGNRTRTLARSAAELGAAEIPKAEPVGD